MCAVNYQKMMKEVFKRIGCNMEEVIDPNVIKEMGDEEYENWKCLTPASITKDPIYKTTVPRHPIYKITSSAIFVSYIAYVAGISDIIRPGFSVEVLQNKFEERNQFVVPYLPKYNHAGVGDILFFEVTDSFNNHDCRTGIVYRSEDRVCGEHRLWVVSVDSENKIYSCVMDRFDINIRGYAQPDYGEETESDEGPSYRLSGEPDLISDGNIKYYGKIDAASPNNKIAVLMGPGYRYMPVPLYPSVYNGTYISVYAEVYDSTPGHGDRVWLLIGVDNFCCGYVPKENVVPAEFQTVFPSGPVAMGDTISFIGGMVYSSDVRDDPISIIQACEGEVIGMNLHSSNPYEIKFDEISTDASTSELIGWVKPESIYELR